jgi:hypothetical protein
MPKMGTILTQLTYRAMPAVKEAWESRFVQCVASMGLTFNALDVISRQTIT